MAGSRLERDCQGCKVRKRSEEENWHQGSSKRRPDVNGELKMWLGQLIEASRPVLTLSGANCAGRGM